MRTWMFGVAMSALASTSHVHARAGAGPFHPLQPGLDCRVDSRSYVRADLFLTPPGGTEVRLGTFGSLDPAGACELAVRNARGGKVCLPQSYDVKAYDIVARAVVGSYGSESAANYKRCFAAVNTEALATRTGYLDFIAPARLAPFKAKLPRVDDDKTMAALRDPDTVWYDELAMIFTYQDSQGDPRGLRANRVGYDTGINSTVPDIRKLVDYFEPNTFKSPFKTVAGADHVPAGDLYALNFWRLPKNGSGVRPVRYWNESNGRWRWTFPIGTVFGEVLYMRAPDDGSWYVFEIRTRTRYAEGWDVAMFRPFASATEMAAAIRAARPGLGGDLTSLVQHLERSDNLVAASLQGAPVYQGIVAPITGALDFVPGTTDVALIKQLLTTTTFRSVEGAIWKEGGGKETYAPSTKAAFSVVPAQYAMGLIPVNEVSCKRCHDQTGRELGDLDDRIVLYGEMWGEDHIFTWHLFDASFDAFTVTDGSRRINPRLVQAGMVQQGKPSTSDGAYGRPLDPVKN